MPDQIYKVSWNGQEKINYTYDGLGRLTNKSVILSASEESQPPRLNNQYTYIDVGTDKTTTLVQSVQTAAGTYTYTYDAVGNILSVSDGTYTNSYVYDSLNQLVRENNQQIGKTYTYAYVNGNITEKKEYAYTTGELPAQPQNTYTWAYTDSTWSDLLTSFNGQTITYDEIGNPLQYRDGMSFTWAKGRQLQSVTKDGLTASYTYDENGLRLSKTVNGVTTNIFRANGQMVGMNSSDGKDMTFMLDGNGNVYGVHYDHYSSNQPKSETYYFAFNAQGDVIGIYEFSGRLMASYDYDEWGNCTVNVLAADNNGHAVDSPDHIAYANPFRYRGYFYDAETGFYYLNSRYYDPGTGRFVNVDKVVSGTGQSVHGYNLFSYGFNNPINMSDADGNMPKWLSGALNIVSGVTQIVSGFALGLSTSCTGVGLVAASFLILNGAATIASGVAKISNSARGTNLNEENFMKTGMRSIGGLIGGKTGESIGNGAYNVANIAATAYSIIGGGATGLSKTVSTLRSSGKVIKQTFSMLKPSAFMDTYSVTKGCFTYFVELPKVWFRASNLAGATTDGILTIDDIINLFFEEEDS